MYLRPWLVLPLLAGCVLDDLERAGDGVFACERHDDCPEDYSCVLERCWLGSPPRVEIRSPEADERVVARPEDAPGFATMTIGIGGKGLDLVDPSEVAEPRVGEGMIEVIVDGEPYAMVTSGNLVGGIAVDVTFAANAGAHRIAARALRADGARYDNDDALATRLVWVDDGSPHVAIARPWPGERFGLEANDIEVEIATINFLLVPPGVDPVVSGGHVHVHYDDPFPECPGDPMCDCCSVGFVAPGEPGNRALGTAVLPPSAAGHFSLTAILRTTEHPAYRHWGEYVFETIAIERRADEGKASDD